MPGTSDLYVGTHFFNGFIKRELRGGKKFLGHRHPKKVH